LVLLCTIGIIDTLVLNALDDLQCLPMAPSEPSASLIPLRFDDRVALVLNDRFGIGIIGILAFIDYAEIR